MKRTHLNLPARLSCVFLGISFLAFSFVGVGCSSAPKVTAQDAMDRLIKAQGGEGVVGLQSEAFRAKTQAQLLETQRLRAVLSHWVDALGGARRLQGLQNIQAFFRIEEEFSHSHIHTTEMADGRFRFDLMLGADSSFSGGYDGKQGWQDSGSWGIGIYPGQRGEPNWGSLCLRALQMETFYPGQRLLADEIVDGRVCNVLGLKPGKGMEERWYFDAQSGLLIRVTKPGGDHGMVISFSDYRTVSKIKLPFRSSLSIGAKTTVYQRLRAEVNTSVAGVDFSLVGAQARQAEEIDNLLKRSVESSVLTGGVNKSSLVHATHTSITNGTKTDLTVYRRDPGMVFVEKESAGAGRTLSGYDGSVGWENSEILGYHVLKEGELASLISFSWLGVDPFLRDRFPLRLKVGETMIGDHKSIIIRLRNFGGISGKFYFDKETAWLLRVEVDENISAGIGAMKMDYSDHRVVGAITMPFCVTYEGGGSQTVLSCKSVELNVEMPDSLFHPRTDLE